MLGAAAALMACAPSEPKGPGVCEHVYFVSGEFLEPEAKAMSRANERWNRIGLDQVCFAPGENRNGGIRRIEWQSPAWLELSKEFGGQNVLGVYRRKTDSITFVSGMTPDVFEIVALHEFGHARGLRHVVQTTPAIMNPAIGDVFDFTEADFAECRRAGACEGDAGEADVVGEELEDDYVVVLSSHQDVQSP